MNYIILGKAKKKGTVNNDSSSLQEYFELGWEVVGSRIDIINKLNSDEIDINNTTIVTISDRKFMYSKIFPNVISFEEFQSIDTSNSTILDWTETLQFRFLNAYQNFVDISTKKYIYHDRDYDLLFNGFDLKESVYNNIDEKYVVLALRYRDHNNHKNADERFFKTLVNKIKKEVTPKVYIVGYGSENFCKDNDCVYIEKLVDYVSLIKNENCLGLIAQSTGTLCLAFMCSETHIQLLDHTNCSEINGDNAVLGGVCIQLCKKGITPYYTLNESIIDSLIENCKKN